MGRVLSFGGELGGAGGAGTALGDVRACVDASERSGTCIGRVDPVSGCASVGGAGATGLGGRGGTGSGAGVAETTPCGEGPDTPFISPGIGLISVLPKGWGATGLPVTAGVIGGGAAGFGGCAAAG
ncbi:MAG: hypothetical protein WAO35_02265, partial [Terriglobia bacterium]